MTAAALGIVSVFVLTFGTGYFVAQEFAYVSADRVELSRQAAAGDARAASAVRVMERLSFMLSAAQLGITVTGLLVGFIAEPAFSAVLHPLLAGTALSDAAISGISIATGFVLSIVIQMVLGELFPKNLALAKAETLAKALAPSTQVYMTISGPVVRLFDNSAAWLLRKVGIEPVEELHHGATLEELGFIIGESASHGSFSSQHGTVLERALAFPDRRAEDVMVPRPDVIGVSSDEPLSAVISRIADTGHSHFPVLGNATDDIVGVLGVRELSAVPAAELDSTRAGTITRPPLLIPTTVNLQDVVLRIRDHDDEFAVVVDEYGGLAGIVTLEDIAEELVGEIVDETDEEPVPTQHDGHWWELDAALRVDEAVSQTGVALPESPNYETVSGLIIATLGRFADPGAVVVVDTRVEGSETVVRTEIEVLSVGRHVPERVRLRRLVSETHP